MGLTSYLVLVVGGCFSLGGCALCGWLGFGIWLFAGLVCLFGFAVGAGLGVVLCVFVSCFGLLVGWFAVALYLRLLVCNLVLVLCVGACWFGGDCGCCLGLFIFFRMFALLLRLVTGCGWVIVVFCGFGIVGRCCYVGVCWLLL